MTQWGLGATGAKGSGTAYLRFSQYDALAAVPVAAVAVYALAAAAFGQGWGPHLVDPEARAAIETGVTASALAAAVLLVVQYRRSRHTSALLLLSAVIAVGTGDFLFSALPGVSGGRGLPLGPYAALALQTVVPITVAMAAFAGDRLTAGRWFWPVVPVGCGCVALVAAAELVGLAVRPGATEATAWPLMAPVAVAGSAVFAAAGFGFVRRTARASVGGWLMGGACFLLGAARLQALAIPVVAAHWVTPREPMRLAAYGLLLTAAVRAYLRIRRADETSALAAQREQIARDLHDGLAQDLAVIAIHGQRMEAELGANHPVTLAARRALAASRQTIVDLSASHAPSTSAALREVADELKARFGIDIAVRDETERTDGLADDLSAKAREQFVRIAREAIVNAAAHGRARHVDVVLASRGPAWRLTIADDGSGIPESQVVAPSGFGLRTMRARARELGAHLTAGPGASGGTVLKLSLPGSTDTPPGAITIGSAAEP